MSFQLETSETGTRAAVDGDFTICQAAELMPQLLSALAAGPRLELDLSGVTEIDGAGLQLLLLAGREAAAAGKALVVATPSPAVRRIFAVGHLTARFIPTEEQ